MDATHFYRQGGNIQMPVQGRGNPMPQPHYAQNPAAYRSPQNQDNTRKRSSKSSRQVNPQQQEDRDEPSGDELDDISARDIAMARYKRNHDYFSEIFTPYNAESIIPPPLDITQSKEELLRLIDEQQQNAKEQQEQHDSMIKQFGEERDQFWKSLAILNDANSLKDIEAAVQSMAETIGGKVEHSTNNVHAVQIPGLKEEPVVLPTLPTPAQRQQQQQQQPLHQGGAPPSSSTSSPSSGHHQQSTPTQQLQSHAQQQQDQQQHHIQQDTTMTDNVDIFTNFDQTPTASGLDGDDDTNDFFNEMVNTGQDDDVSEFLNSDMDFEQSEKQGDSMQE